MGCRTKVGAWGLMLFVAALATGQETAEQAELLAQLAKLDGKVKFDPAHPKRVIAIDV